MNIKYLNFVNEIKILAYINRSTENNLNILLYE